MVNTYQNTIRAQFAVQRAVQRLLSASGPKPSGQMAMRYRGYIPPVAVRVTAQAPLPQAVRALPPAQGANSPYPVLWLDGNPVPAPWKFFQLNGGLTCSKWATMTHQQQIQFITSYLTPVLNQLLPCEGLCVSGHRLGWSGELDAMQGNPGSGLLQFNVDAEFLFSTILYSHGGSLVDPAIYGTAYGSAQYLPANSSMQQYVNQWVGDYMTMLATYCAQVASQGLLVPPATVTASGAIVIPPIVLAHLATAGVHVAAANPLGPAIQRPSYQNDIRAKFAAMKPMIVYRNK